MSKLKLKSIKSVVSFLLSYYNFTPYLYPNFIFVYKLDKFFPEVISCSLGQLLLYCVFYVGVLIVDIVLQNWE